jgi:Ca2+-transporting ATPase
MNRPVPSDPPVAEESRGARPGTEAERPAWHSHSAPETLTRLGVSADHGLDAAEIESRRRFGFNEIPQARPPAAWQRFLAQFAEPVILILIGAAVISGFLADLIDMAAILAIVFLNGVIGFVQEERAERALAALRSLSAPTAKVIRGGQLVVVPARDLVPGDVIQIEAGDRIPADARLLRSYDLKVQEATLTGESVPVLKQAHEVLAPETPLGDRKNMVYLGTTAVAGKADAVVVATGVATELGRIAGMLETTTPEPTPLQRRLAGLGRILIAVVLVLVTVIFLLQIARGGPLLESFLLSVSLAVAAVPEGLPAVVTLVLAIGLQRMVRRHTLIRKLPCVETLGSVTVICTDKTGTLTRNEMTVREVVTGSAHYLVTGSGFDPRGSFLLPKGGESTVDEPIDPEVWPDLLRALRIAAWCVSARVCAPAAGESSWRIVGDPTEAALIIAALKADVRAEGRDKLVLHELPFDSDRKVMSVVVRGPRESAVMYSKGAPEVILEKCAREWRHNQVVPLSPARRQEIQQIAADMASRALRVLALADRHHPDASQEEVCQEEDLIFVGLIGMIDPPREEVKDAVQTCRQAGIRPIMITGDHPATALAIARELGLTSQRDAILSGTELDSLSDDRLTAIVGEIAVYARVSADHKLRVVRAWKRRGEIVAMTGDGVNDAPALQAADIGIAMGRTGSDVTKEAADMVLLDDNFASIVNAVEEGRGIYDNLQKFIHYLLASNSSEVLLMLLAALIGWPAPLTAVQLLWINLVTDGFPALALGLEPPESDLMQRPPRHPGEPVITRRRGSLILTHGIFMGLVGAGTFFIHYQEESHLPQARAATFCTMALTQLAYSLACRSPNRTLAQLGFLSNPQLLAALAFSAMLQLAVFTLPATRRVFGLPADLQELWPGIVALALLPVTLVELTKLALATARRRSSSTTVDRSQDHLTPGPS